MDTILALPAFREWCEAALREPWTTHDEVDEDPIEVFRAASGKAGLTAEHIVSMISPPRVLVGIHAFHRAGLWFTPRMDRPVADKGLNPGMVVRRCMVS